MHDDTATIAEFLEAAAAKQPTPGGGAVAALAGALAAAMGEMVLQYSVNKKSLAEHASFNAEVLGEFTRARAVLSELMAEDQAVFAELTDAKKKGEDTTPFVEAAIAVPQAIGASALILLDLAVRIAPTSNSFLSSDLAVCGELAMATVRCAVHNVKANLPDVAEADRPAIEADCQHLISEGVGRINRLTDAIAAAKAAA